MVSIWGENVLGYLSGDVICFEKRTVLRERTDNRAYFHLKHICVGLFFLNI